MTDLEKYENVFLSLFDVTREQLSTLNYLRGRWDSLQHIDMITMLEETFDISINSTDMVLFNSYEKGKSILRNYGVEV